MQGGSERGPGAPQRWHALALAAIALLSLGLNLWNNDFSRWYHGDERKKLRFVAESTQDFHHPILAGDTRYLVTSSFAYERFYRGAALANQPINVRLDRSRYEWVFRCYEVHEFRPAHRSFAFTNPVIRVVDLRRPVGACDDSRSPFQWEGRGAIFFPS